MKEYKGPGKEGDFLLSVIPKISSGDGIFRKGSRVIPLFKVAMSNKASSSLEEVLYSGYIGQGSQVEKFEEILKEYFNHPYVLTTNSCTSAIHLALHMVKNHNTYVISTPLTCVATNSSIINNRLEIRWADVDPNTCNIDLNDAEDILTKSTNVPIRCITVVHWGGNPVDLNRLEEIKDKCEKKFKFRPVIIEDCAHAFGSFPGRKYNNFACFSFQAVKQLTCGDGGALICPDKESYERAKKLRWYGISRDKSRIEQDITEFGFKFHMNDINAAIGIANFPLAIENIEKCKANVRFYEQNLNCMIKHHPESSCYMATIKLNDPIEFQNFMAQNEVEVSPIHKRNDKYSGAFHPWFQRKLPGMDHLEKSMTCIPCGWWIGEEEREKIVRLVKQYTH